MAEQQTAAIGHKRPVAISIICVIGFLGASVSFALVFSPMSHQIGAWYPPYLAACAVIGLACMFGLLMMRKWAVYAYTAVAAINQVVFVYKGVWNIWALVIPGVVIVVMFLYVKRMR